MALQGTVAFQFDQYRNGIYTITGLTTVGDFTPGIRSMGFVIGSYQLTGFTAAGITATLYGSNDNVNFYPNPFGAAANGDGIYGIIVQNSTSTNCVPLYFSWLIGGTFTSGSGTITAVLMSTFG